MAKYRLISRKLTVDVICANCGTLFEGRGRAMFCCADCRKNYHRKLKEAEKAKQWADIVPENING